LIIGNKNAITYKEIFPLLKNNEMWLGYNQPAPKLFMTPSMNSDRNNVEDDGKGHFMASFGNIGWFTNLDISKRHEDLILFKRYCEDPLFYLKYDNYDAINIDKVKYIPEDYDGVMGVPITFLDNYNPDQFEIIDINPHFYMIIASGLPKPKQLTMHNVGRKDPYARVLIRNLHPLTPKA
jgi:hypothetical protein